MTKLHPTEPLATFELSISSSDVDTFFDAVGWQLPARPAAPPTLATIFRDGEFAALQQLKIPLRNVLHGEQKYRFPRELVAGEKYKCETFLNSHYEKSGGAGAMAFYVFQTNLKNAAGETFVECLTTVIVRGAA